MNIHLPAILMFTRGIGFWPIPIWLRFRMCAYAPSIRHGTWTNGILEVTENIRFMALVGFMYFFGEYSPKQMVKCWLRGLAMHTFVFLVCYVLLSTFMYCIYIIYTYHIYIYISYIYIYIHITYIHSIYIYIHIIYIYIYTYHMYIYIYIACIIILVRVAYQKYHTISYKSHAFCNSIFCGVSLSVGDLQVLPFPTGAFASPTSGP